ncbi:WYL domain-containing protein [Pseudomonadota bacterium]
MSHESIHRFNHVVKLLIDSKNGMTVSEIEDALKITNFREISTERLRKLLRNMSNDRYLNVERIGSGYNDRWIASHNPGENDVATMTPTKVVGLALLAKSDINQLLPRIMRDEIAPEQELARQRLDYIKNAKGSGVLGWVDRVRLGRPSVRMAIDREEPEVSHAVEGAVHEALINRSPLKIRYWSGHLSDELSEALVYPIALDCQMRWTTLVCQVAEPFRTKLGKRSAKYDEDYVQMPLHRISKAVIENDVSLPKSFDSNFTLENYVSRCEPDRPRGGQLRFTQGRKIKLVALVTEPYANDLLDSPLETVGEPQQLVLQDNGWFRLTADLVQSDNLLWWCVAMAKDMIVIEPEGFRQEVVHLLDSGRALYERHKEA